MSAVGGKLDLAAMGRLHFRILSRDQQAAAIRRLAASGMSDYGISHATGLAVEQIRRVLSEVAA
jgi:hypothetical protein